MLNMKGEKDIFGGCIAATIAVESPHHALRGGGLGTKSVCAAQNIHRTFLV